MKKIIFKAILFMIFSLFSSNSIFASSRGISERSKKYKLPDELVDEYTNYVYQESRKPVVVNEAVSIEMENNPGLFNVYVKNRKHFSKYEPVFSKLNYSSSTCFFLKSGKNLYKLSSGSSIFRQMRKTKNSVQAVYQIPSVARVLFDFSLPSFGDDKESGIVKVAVYTTNLSRQMETFSLKAVFDTYFGERTNHFSLFSGKKCDSEEEIADFEKERIVSSSGSLGTVQFLLNGKGISAPQQVFLGNMETLKYNKWNPEIVSGRSFNTVLSYNNSAIGINWKETAIEPKETFCTVFYLGVSCNPESKIGYDFLEYLDSQADDFVEPKVQKSDEDELSEGLEKIKESRKNIEFNVQKITRSQLDPVYIQQLIDRINSLQSDPQLVDRSELRRLNAELDKILMRVRQ